MTESRRWLRDYAERRDERAFGDLVARHVNIVYSTALRLVNHDAALAEEITQTVFTDLARKAKVLPPDLVVGGWLYRHTCFVSAKTRRAELRRHVREREAVLMNTLNDPGDTTWNQVAPVLDEAMNRLGDRDRNAIVLRFFEQQPLREVGAALGASEDAARMRVERALERLRKFLVRRGVTLTGAALATALAGEAVSAAPAGLAAGVTSAALAGAASVSTGLAMLKLSTWARMKFGLAGAAMIAVLITPLVVQHHSLVQLREENAALQERLKAMTNAVAPASLLAKSGANANELQALRREHHELLRLRGEVGMLRQQLAKTLEDLAATALAAETKTNIPPAQVVVDAKFAECPKAKLKDLSLSWVGTGNAVLTESQMATVLEALKQTDGVDLLTAPRVTTLSGRQAQIGSAQQVELGGTNVMIGLVLDVIPSAQPDGKGIRIAAVAHLTELVTNAPVGDLATPTVRRTESSGEAVIWDGQTLLLQQPISPVGAGTASLTDRMLLVFVTPTLVDPAGNRIRAPDPIPASTTGSSASP